MGKGAILSPTPTILPCCSVDSKWRREDTHAPMRGSGAANMNIHAIERRSLEIAEYVRLKQSSEYKQARGELFFPIIEMFYPLSCADKKLIQRWLLLTTQFTSTTSMRRSKKDGEFSMYAAVGRGLYNWVMGGGGGGGEKRR